MKKIDINNNCGRVTTEALLNYPLQELADLEVVKVNHCRLDITSKPLFSTIPLGRTHS